MPRLSEVARHSWRAADHHGCVVCTSYVARRHGAAVAAIHRVAAASLPGPTLAPREGAGTARDPDAWQGSGVSTAHTVADTEVRAARAQSDTAR